MVEDGVVDVVDVGAEDVRGVGGGDVRVVLSKTSRRRCSQREVALCFYCLLLHLAREKRG